jgi:hypothetical protein
VVGIGQFADENGCDEVVRYLELLGTWNSVIVVKVKLVIAGMRTVSTLLNLLLLLLTTIVLMFRTLQRCMFGHDLKS